MLASESEENRGGGSRGWGAAREDELLQSWSRARCMRGEPSRQLLEEARWTPSDSFSNAWGSTSADTALGGNAITASMYKTRN